MGEYRRIHGMFQHTARFTYGQLATTHRYSYGRRLLALSFEASPRRANLSA